MRNLLMSAAAIMLSSTALPAAAAAPDAVATTATSQDGGQTNSQAEQSSQPRQRARGSDRQICVNEAMSTGRIRHRVCHTQAEWDRLQGGDDQ